MKSKTINKLAALPIVISGIVFAVIGFFINGKNINFDTNVDFDLGIIFMVVGIIIIIAGLFILIKLNIKYRKYLNVKTSGVRVDARISGVEVDITCTINNKNPYYVLCYAINPMTGQEQTFRSENIWEDVRKIIEDNKIDILPVYIDQGNYNNYYVDVSVLNIK